MRVFFLKVKKDQAEKKRRELIESGNLNTDFKVFSENEFVCIPVRKKVRGTMIEQDVEPRKRPPRSIKEVLGIQKSSFDTIGEIALIEIPPELESKQKEVGEAILRTHKNVRSVYRKYPVSGEYRTRKLELLAGEDNPETVYTEHGVRMRLDVSRVYFSPRLSAERLRIAKLVKPGEVVAALFAGVGPYPLVITKVQPQVKKIYAVELNPDAVEYMRQNIALNRMEDRILIYEGDVRKVCPEKLFGKADRVLMPLPMGGESFLEIALRCTKPGGVVHFYHFDERDKAEEAACNKINETAKKIGRSAEIINKKIVRQYSPTIIQVVVDGRIR